MQKTTKNLLIVTFFFAITLTLAGCTPKTADTQETDHVEETQMADADKDKMENEDMMDDDGEPEDEDMMDKTWTLTDSTYTTDTSYPIPNGDTELVKFTIETDTDGVVTDVEVVSTGEAAPISVKQQKSFSDNIDALIVGKKIADIEAVDTVGTSSLTTGAFFEAVTELQEEMEMDS